MNENKVILYTTNCPMCKLLKLKLDSNKIEYEICNDVDTMLSKGFSRAPILEVDGVALTLKDALKWAEEHKCI